MTASTTLSNSEVDDLVRDGFVILHNIVPERSIDVARQVIEEGMPATEHRLLAPAELATHPDVIGTFRNSPIADIMRNAMGPYPEIVSCQIALTPGFDRLGGRPSPHVDGSWSGKIPERADEIEVERGRPRDAEKYFGKNDELRGTNDGLLWQDPDKRISLGSYTALVGIALNDQLEPGNGQFAVLKGMHEDVELAFRVQRASNGVIGPEGLGWPRIRIGENSRPHLNGLPENVRKKAYAEDRREDRGEKWHWPELTPVCLKAGDVVIALHSCPHTPTPNFGPNPRMNLYFRLRRWRDGNPNEGTRRVGHGVSDHPDRGYYGQYLEYPEHYDPWQTSIDKLCDHWSEWDCVSNRSATKPKL